MNIQETENSVDMLLSTFGFKKQEGEEQPLRVLLHHLYTAVAMYKDMDFKDKAIIAKTNKKFRSIFEINFNLKQRKRNNKEKDRVPPTTPLQDKENKKEKDEKTTDTPARENFDLDDDQMAFWEVCKKYIGKKYSEELVQAFFYYWAEKDEKSGKMLWQITKEKKTWDIKFRLAGWSKRSYARNDEAAAIRLKKVKSKQGKEEQTSGQQQAIAAEREQANAEREAEIERSKAGAVSYEEWLRLRKR